MYGAGTGVFALWGYCIAKARPPQGTVELNPKVLADTLGTTEQEINKAIEYLMSPDPNSRSKSAEGRRLLKIGQFEYQLVNFQQHRIGRDEEERKQYMREYMRNKRKNTMSTNVKQDVSQRKPKLAKAEADTDTDTNTDTDTDTDTDTEVLQTQIKIKNKTLNKKTTICNEPKISFNYESKKIENITPNDISRWKQAYPAVNIEVEILGAAEWLVSNPAKRKSNVRRFLTNWFKRTQEKGGSYGRAEKKEKYTRKDVEDLVNENIKLGLVKET